MTTLAGLRPLARRFTHPLVPAGMVAAVAGATPWVRPVLAWVVIALAAGYAISGSV